MLTEFAPIDSLIAYTCTAFAENIVIIANPSKSGGAWWYGKTVKENKSGFFPSTYVQELETGESSVLCFKYTNI